jgi:alpha-ketoglutaric semialdehyde dehydrogenase
VALANGVRYGLATSLHGSDLQRLLDCAERVHSGIVKLNAPTSGVDFYTPSGGEKDSSFSPREQGLEALAFYSSTRTVTVAP